MWQEFLSAVALLLVFEGLLPFLSPDKYRSTMSQMMALGNSTLRNIGLGSMLAGVVLLYLVR